MQIKLDLRKSLEENAASYFDAAKKARKKLKGVTSAIETTKKREAKAPQERPATQQRIIKRKQAWYEKFRWFLSSDGFLCIGGRDATTNELVIKKQTAADDWVFHTDMAGSPFVIVKAEGKEVPDTTMEEAAQFTASNSKAWKNGLSTLEVFYVRPDQVTKEAQAGEALPRGAFMIRGKTRYKHPKLALSACVIEHKARKMMVAPRGACEKHSLGAVVDLVQGNGKASDVGKQLQRLLDTDEDLDTIIRALPPGGVKIKKQG